MTYSFVTEREDYTDFAAGRVFQSLPGAFPVRLASEIFQHCMALREQDGLTAPCTLYDPCCGGAYMLSTIAYLHRDKIRCVIGSDVDNSVLNLAERNLALLTPHGLDRRIAQLNAHFTQYGKLTFIEAADSARRLKQALLDMPPREPIKSYLFAANALKCEDPTLQLAQFGEMQIDLVITDVPYDDHTSWTVDPTVSNPVWQLLESLRAVLSSQALVAIASDKHQKAAHEVYKRVDQFQIGKRRVTILKLL